MKLLQTVTSAQLWKGGIKRETLDQLSRIGICLGSDATTSAIDCFRKDFDAAAIACKEDLENQLAQGVKHVEQDLSDIIDDMTYVLSQAFDATDELDATVPFGDFVSNEESHEGEYTDDEPDEPLSEGSFLKHNCPSETPMDVDQSCTPDPAEPSTGSKTINPGFTFCWDNVGKKVKTRHPTADTKNRYINFALAYVAMNRIPSTHLKWRYDTTTPAVDIASEDFLPSTDDISEVKDRITIIVGRILTHHLPWFKHYFSDCATPHIIHFNSVQSSQKSVLVNLGVFKENPSTTDGAIAIYERLQKYVPPEK